MLQLETKFIALFHVSPLRVEQELKRGRGMSSRAPWLQKVGAFCWPAMAETKTEGEEREPTSMTVAAGAGLLSVLVAKTLARPAE